MLHLDTFPNAPYVVGAAKNEVKSTIESLDRFELNEDRYAVYAHYQKGSVKRKLVFDTHLDHPGYVTLSPYETLALGSIFNPETLETANQYTPVEVDFFDTTGSLIDTGALTKFRTQNGYYYGHIESAQLKNDLPLNVQANLRLPTRVEGNTAFMRSADNQAVTAALLDLMAWVNTTEPDANITCVFTKLEEIRQISATAIAERNGTPYGSFDANTFIFALEADLVNQSTTLGISTNTTHTDGPIIRIGDEDLIFMLPDQTNQAESLAYNVAEKLGIKFQTGVGAIHSDATPYILFSKSPHVIGIQVPCKYKHNFDPSVGFVAEQVNVDDIENVVKLMQAIILEGDETIQHHPESLLKKDGLENDTHLLAQKRYQWNLTRKRAEPRLKLGKLVPESPAERLMFMVNSAFARF